MEVTLRELTVAAARFVRALGRVMERLARVYAEIAAEIGQGLEVLARLMVPMPPRSRTWVTGWHRIPPSMPFPARVSRTARWRDPQAQRQGQVVRVSTAGQFVADQTPLPVVSETAWRMKHRR